MIYFFSVLAIVIVIAGSLVVIKLPKVVRISRSLQMETTPEKVFPYLNDPRLIQTWNAFMDGDAHVKVTYSGPPSGVGARWDWEGSKAGAGAAEIIASESDRRVGLRLDFRRPFRVTNFGEYTVIPSPTGCTVTWTIDETALIPRILSVFIDLEKMIGQIFETGLQKLRVWVEPK